MQIIKGTSPIIAIGFAIAISAFTYNHVVFADSAKRSYDPVHVQVIFDKLAMNSGTTSILPLVILKSPMVNAWTDGKNITITTGLLDLMNGNDDELALVLGHEMGHVINYDLEHGIMEDVLGFPVDNRYKEAAADKIGAFIAMRAGFDVCNGKSIFAKFKVAFGDDAGAMGHPDQAFRLDQLDLPQCNRHFFGTWF